MYKYDLVYQIVFPPTSLFSFKKRTEMKSTTPTIENIQTLHFIENYGFYVFYCYFTF